MIPDPPQPIIGEASNAIKIIGVNLQDDVYTVDFDCLSAVDCGFEVRTSWKIKDAQGTIEEISPDLYRLRVRVPEHMKNSHLYQHGRVKLTIAAEKSD